MSKSGLQGHKLSPGRVIGQITLAVINLDRSGQVEITESTQKSPRNQKVFGEIQKKLVRDIGFVAGLSLYPLIPKHL